MSKYIDGFVIPIHPDKLTEYQRIASLSAKVWIEHGALEYIESAADDLRPCTPEAKSALELLGAQPEETLVFAYIVYESREHRDSVNAKVMADQRMIELCPTVNGVFDFKRMLTGGFRVIVSAKT
jgi:uncharacterized protein YbaA (DUF1428 family)